MENLELYEKLRTVPKEAKKTIVGGRLKGFTDINPMWRIKILTEHFGICGFGWRYEIVSQELKNGADNEIAAFVTINLFIKSEDKWSEPIVGIGGSMFVSKESRGLYTSDECFKMALTDALGVSCKALGIGADVYFEKDSNKYDKQEPKEEPKQAPITKRIITDREVTGVWNGKIYEGKYIYLEGTKIEPPTEQIEKLKSHPKFKDDGKA